VALAAAARTAGSRCVIHIHAHDLSTPRRGMATSYQILTRLCSGVVVLEDAAAAHVQGWAPHAQVVVIRNGVDTNRFQPGKQNETELRLALMGTIGHRKGVADLLEAMRRLPDTVKCDLVGGGAEEGRGAFEKIFDASADLRATGRMVMHGQLDREAAADVLRRASAFVLPSHAEGMPMALLEAMSCGLPVVVTDVGSMGEIVRSAQCGFVITPGDVDALVQQIGLLLDNKALRRALGAAARAAAIGQFGIEGATDRTLAFYRRAGLKVGPPDA
jgi:glycosyltransferase involved in cell wall biosynthesis